MDNSSEILTFPHSLETIVKYQVVRGGQLKPRNIKCNDTDCKMEPGAAESLDTIVNNNQVVAGAWLLP